MRRYFVNSSYCRFGIMHPHELNHRTCYRGGVRL